MSDKLFSGFTFGEEATEVASIATPSDPNYLPFHILAAFLSFLWERGERLVLVGVLIQLCIPMRKSRLTGLIRVGSGRAAGDDIDVHVREGVISFPIIHRDGLLFELNLVLPGFWTQCFPSHELHPFKSLEGEVKRLGRAFASNRYPVYPTLGRIRASSSRIFGLGSMTRLDRAFLAGEIPGSDNAAPHYLHLRANQLRDQWVVCVLELQQKLAPRMPKDMASLLTEPSPPQPRCEGHIQYLSFEKYAVIEHLVQLRAFADETWASVAAACSREDRENRIRRAAQATCLYAYALKSISLLLRATGEKTIHLAVDEHRYYLREKDSKVYHEHRVGRLCEVASKQDAAIRETIGALIENKLVQCVDETPHSPSLIVRKGQWFCEPMTAQAFRSGCSALDVQLDEDTAMNFGRHIGSTVAYRQIPEYSWYEMNGLQAGYFGSASAFSMLGEELRETGANCIDSYLTARGLTPVFPAKGVLK